MVTNLSTLYPGVGAKHKRKIIGRGRGSGHGGSSTRGMKGQSSRSGEGPRLGFEGGQMPIVRRIPKRGFSNITFRKKYYIVRISDLERIYNPGETVNTDTLITRGVVQPKGLIKIIGTGTISKPLSVKVDKLTPGARDKIVAAGGTVVE